MKTTRLALIFLFVTVFVFGYTVDRWQLGRRIDRLAERQEIQSTIIRLYGEQILELENRAHVHHLEGKKEPPR